MLGFSAKDSINVLIILLLCVRAEGGRRRGYMGHLTRIANSIVHNCDKGANGPQIQHLISGEASFLSSHAVLYWFMQCTIIMFSRWTLCCVTCDIPILVVTKA